MWSTSGSSAPCLMFFPLYHFIFHTGLISKFLKLHFQMHSVSFWEGIPSDFSFTNLNMKLYSARICPEFLRHVKEKISQPSYISKENPQAQMVLMQISGSQLHVAEVWSHGLQIVFSLLPLLLVIWRDVLWHGNSMRIANWQISNHLRHSVMKGGDETRSN